MAELPKFKDGQAFHIVDQQNEETPGPDGQMIEEWRIDFDTPSGIQSFVRIPGDLYTAAYVHQAIAEKAREIEAVEAGPKV